MQFHGVPTCPAWAFMRIIHMDGFLLLVYWSVGYHFYLYARMVRRDDFARLTLLETRSVHWGVCVGPLPLHVV